MANRAEHIKKGVLVGAGMAIYKAREQKLEDIIFEAIGGGFGGYIGSRLPDVIEPASWPGHRQHAHSIMAGGGIIYSLYKLLDKWEEYYRSQATYYSVKKNEEDLYWHQKLLYTVLEIISLILTGVFIGLSSGYISHLALDCGTTKGLPLL